MLVFDESKRLPKLTEKYSWSVSFIINGLRVKDIEKGIRATRNGGRWSDIEAIILPEVILGTATLEKILSIDVLEFLVTLLGYGEESN